MNYQLSRRSFIRFTTATALSQLLLGCSDSETVAEVLFLADSIPLQLIGDFRKTINYGNKVDFKPQTQLVEIVNSLLKIQEHKQSDSNTNKPFARILNKSIAYPGIITLGDFWLSSAIQQNLLQPLAVKSLTNWQKLPVDWQKLVIRDRQGNVTPDGRVYGAPYRWGSTIIAYRSDKLDELGLTITDWQDLWHPKLNDRLSLLDSPREVIGLTLKKLGYSYNTDDLSSIPDLERELLALNERVKLYSSDRYLEPLILGDTWVAVGWSTDILPLLKRYSDLKFVIPASGTSLWADIWVKPNADDSVEDESISSVIEQWIDFCWSDKSAKQISLFTEGISPILPSIPPSELPQDLQDNIFLNSEAFAENKSEFLLPQTPQTQKQYQDLWLKIRQSS